MSHDVDPSIPQHLRELRLTRVFAAPRQVVFNAWIDPVHVANWWGPARFTSVVRAWDARPGGAIDLDMIGPDGTAYPMGGEFREIIVPERLVFVSSAFNDANGQPQLEALNTITFAESNGQTTLMLHAVIIRATPDMAGPLLGMAEGWTQSLEKLEELMASG